MSVRVSPKEISIGISRLSMDDGSHQSGWTSSSLLRAQEDKGRANSLSLFFDLRYLYSPALGCWIRLWDLHQQHLRLGVKPLDPQGLRPLDSNELHNRIPGSLACRHRIVRLLVSLTLGAYSYNKSSFSLSDIYIYMVMFYCLFLWRSWLLQSLNCMLLSSLIVSCTWDTLNRTIAFHVTCTSVLFAQSFLIFIRDEFSLTIT